MRYALRSLWHARTFSLVAILCLGIGVGLNTTIFSIVDGVLLKPYPYHEPDRLVVFYGEQPTQGIGGAWSSYLDLRDYKAATSAFSAIAGLQMRSMTITDDGGEPDRYSGAAVPWDLFPMLGVAPVAGRAISEADDRPGADPVVVINYDIWTVRYQRHPGVIGRQVSINGQPTVIIGVMPEGFAFPEMQRLWIPVTPAAVKEARDVRSLYTFARLAPGVPLERANAELATVATNLARQYPDTNDGWTVRARTLREEYIPPDVSLVIWLMMAGVTLVLFIACSNVANLLLARATVRRREIAVRAALGAERRRIVRQLVAESVLLGLCSVPIGVLLAQVGTRLIAAGIPANQVPYYITWEVDWRTLAYSVAIAVATATVFGLLPALQATRGNLHDDLKEGTRGNSVRRSLLRTSLVVAQVSLALVALVSAMLFVRSFANFRTFDVGFDPSPLMTMRFYMTGQEYEASDARARRVRDIVDRLERLPGVEAAFASNLIPLGSGGGDANVVVDGQPHEQGREPWISFVGVTPHFHRTLGVPLVAGREHTDAEGATRSPLAVINQTMATRFWRDRPAVGGRFRVVNSREIPDWFTVIGVAPDIQHDNIDADDEPFPAAYVPYPFQPAMSTGLTIRVAAGEPAGIAAPAREQIRSSDRNLPVSAVATLEDVRRLGYWEYELFGWIFGTIGGVGLVLAAIGVYGVLSYAVSQRSQEIGVRVALGAARRDVLRLIVGHGLALTGIGIGVGLVLAPLATWLGRSLFFKVSPFDPVSFGLVALFLLMVALAASYVPALRATRVDPVSALRGE
jgi:predicted permease